MKFGKLPSLEGITLSLPPQDRMQPLGLSGQPTQALSSYVGLPRWASKDWIDHLYPKGTQARDYLSYYAQSFTSIELNSTHYRIPTPEMVINWREASQPGFHFCPKIPQVISHHNGLQHGDPILGRFTQVIADFGDRLGHSFLQLPERFGPESHHILAAFLAQWPTALPLAIEFRHPGWFQHAQLLPAAGDLLAHYQIAPVITDVAGRRDVLHQTLTSSTVMIRLVGNGLHPSDYERADAWMTRLRHWQEQGLERVYLFAHQPDDVQAMEYGRYLSQQLNAKLGQSQPTPGVPSPPGDQQMSLF